MARVWMVAYDISGDRERRGVEKMLSGFGKRVQKSVFECQFGADDLPWLRSRLAALLSGKGDSIRYYPVCTHCQSRTLFFGDGAPPAPGDPYLIL